MQYLKPSITALVLFAGSATHAATVNGTGLISPDVIFGSGNTNADWTGDTGGGIEVALRGKLRYDENGNPQNVFNYDGDSVYLFDAASSAVPVGQSVFNFEFAVNSDVDGTLNRNVNDIDWNLQVDVDPDMNVSNIFDADPFNVPFADHAFGDNTTGNGDGMVAGFLNLADYAFLFSSNNVAQNSQNLGFNTAGFYTFTLTGSDSTGVLAATSIHVVVENPAIVPLPATLPLLLGSVALLGTAARRKR